MTDIVWALRTSLPLEAVEIHVAQLDRAGVLGLSEEEGRTTVWFPTKVDDLSVDGVWESVAAGGWDESWRAQLEPVSAGGFVITPPWKATGSGDEIIIEPAQAFGTGHHETTIGCLTAMARLDVAGSTVLDVGTGTGILGIAAAKLGAAHVVACDIDELAVSAATANSHDNGTAAVVEVVPGSLDVIDGRFDIVLANLTTQTLCELARALASHCRSSLVASGVSVERGQEAVTALERAGFTLEVVSGGEWLVLTGRKT